MTTENTDVLIVGSSIIGLSMSIHLKMRLPNLRVVVLGPLVEDEKRPYVGESLVEPGILFYRHIGMGPHLDQHQELKNGLSYYYRLTADLSDPNYSVHFPGYLHHLARQLNRPVFDQALRDRAHAVGVEFKVGKAKQVRMGTQGARHEIDALVGDQEVTFNCRWVIDASGRSRVIGQKVASYTRPTEGQRSTFWIRLADYEPFLNTIKVHSRRPFQYGLWESTHHFMGRNFWVWVIPLKDKDHRYYMSIGLLWRPDLIDHDIKDTESFASFLDQHHPCLSRMIRSGKTIDEQRYVKFFYYCDKPYSSDGWFLVGDAARCVDALYSTGISMSTIQIVQITSLIERELKGLNKPSDFDILGRIWKRLVATQQDDITNQYETMHMPASAAMRRYWNVCAWFNGLLPLWWNGFFTNPDSAELIDRLIAGNPPASRSAWTLFKQVAEELGPDIPQETYDQMADIDDTVLHRFDCPKEELPRALAGMFRKRMEIRLRLLKLTKWKFLPEQLRWIGTEYARSKIIPWVLPILEPKAFRDPQPVFSGMKPLTEAAPFNAKA